MAAAAALTFTAGNAWGTFTITQGDAPFPEYAQTIDFDEPGVPAGVPLGSPWEFYTDSDGITFTSGNGFLAVDDWDTLAGIAGGTGDGAELAGGFSVRMVFDGDVTEASWQGWADGSPGFPFGGINVFLFDDGVQVATYSGVASFGTTIGSYFNVVADGGDKFDEIRFFNGAFNSFTTYVDNLSFSTPVGPVEVAFDLKPGSCPNSFNPNSRGVLPAAVLGTMDFDVTTIDLDSIVLSRADGVGGMVMPFRTSYDDVGAPFFGEPCECDESDPDEIDDLTMKFKSQAVVAELELDTYMGGDMVELVISGVLVDGTPFEGLDCLRLVPPNGGNPFASTFVPGGNMMTTK
ncbi:MAG: hypothetical protein ACYTGP_05415 [Planctomycetota bacterium]